MNEIAGGGLTRASPTRTLIAEANRSESETPMLGGISARRRGLVLVFDRRPCSGARPGFFARLVDHLDVWTILCGRAFFGGLFIVVAAVFEWRRGVLGPQFRARAARAADRRALGDRRSRSYIAALKTTTVAEVMVIYATLPFVTAGARLSR